MQTRIGKPKNLEKSKTVTPLSEENKRSNIPIMRSSFQRSLKLQETEETKSKEVLKGNIMKPVAHSLTNSKTSFKLVENKGMSSKIFNFES